MYTVVLRLFGDVCVYLLLILPPQDNLLETWPHTQLSTPSTSLLYVRLFVSKNDDMVLCCADMKEVESRGSRNGQD
jgi:hypothetical protein